MPESSPLTIGETLYLGADTTDVVALRTSDGGTRWRFNSPGAIKASPSFHDGHVFVADYEGSMFERQEDLSDRAGRLHPVISDGKRLYLVGYFELIGLEPTKR